MIEEKLYPSFNAQEDGLDTPDEDTKEDVEGDTEEEEPVTQDEDEESSEM